VLTINVKQLQGTLWLPRGHAQGRVALAFALDHKAHTFEKALAKGESNQPFGNS
jgi:hypothetical protein